MSSTLAILDKRGKTYTKKVCGITPALSKTLRKKIKAQSKEELKKWGAQKLHLALRKQVRLLAGCSKLDCGLVLARGKTDACKLTNLTEEVIVVLSSDEKSDVDSLQHTYVKSDIAEDEMIFKALYKFNPVAPAPVNPFNTFGDAIAAKKAANPFEAKGDTLKKRKKVGALAGHQDLKPLSENLFTAPSRESMDQTFSGVLAEKTALQPFPTPAAGASDSDSDEQKDPGGVLRATSTGEVLTRGSVKDVLGPAGRAKAKSMPVPAGNIKVRPLKMSKAFRQTGDTLRNLKNAKGKVKGQFMKRNKLPAFKEDPGLPAFKEVEEEEDDSDEPLDC